MAIKKSSRKGSLSVGERVVQVAASRGSDFTTLFWKHPSELSKVKYARPGWEGWAGYPALADWILPDIITKQHLLTRLRCGRANEK